MNIRPTKAGGRIIEGDVPWGRFSITIDKDGDSRDLRIITADGVQVGAAHIVMTQPMPAGFDSKEEERRAKAGGCCGQPTE